MKKMLACIVLLAAQAAFAGVVPKPSEFDSRIRTVEYNPLDVYEITAHYGYEVHFYFSKNETITSVTAGDELGWTIGPKKPKNHIFLKPKEEKPTTNMTVLTMTAQGEERVYVFSLKAEWPADNPGKENDMMFHVRFTYPEQEAKQLQGIASTDLLAEKLTNAASDKARNYRYSFAGAESLEPEEIYDNGTFTYIKFAPNREIPSIFHVNPDGSEQITDSHGEDEWRVVHRVSERLIFRKGNAVAGVFNDAFDPKGSYNRTGTVSPEVKRVLKRGE